MVPPAVQRLFHKCIAYQCLRRESNTLVIPDSFWSAILDASMGLEMSWVIAKVTPKLMKTPKPRTPTAMFGLKVCSRLPSLSTLNDERLNPRLEELLRPIQHPSELATHPTLSLPFLDPALPEMLRSTEEKLRQERANLWRAKNLNRHFIGDESWIPVGAIEGTNDWDLFEPRSKPVPEPANKRRKISSNNQTSRNGMNGLDHSSQQVADSPLAQALEASNEGTENTKSSTMQEDSSEHHPSINGIRKDTEDIKDQDVATPESSALTIDQTSQSNEQQDDVQDDSVQKTSPPPTRRITRALAAEQDGSGLASASGSSPESTASSLDHSLLQPDPFFLPPPSFAASHRNPLHLARIGLPVDEFLETRRLLTTYIQKQEESVRGYEAFLGKLIRAKRMRDKVWEWCKAEGHVGEWSDGEDWIDSEAWGLAPDELKKGKDEEEVDGQEDTGRKAKRRRRD